MKKKSISWNKSVLSIARSSRVAHCGGRVPNDLFRNKPKALKHIITLALLIIILYCTRIVLWNDTVTEKNNRKTTRRICQVYASHWLLILSILTHTAMWNVLQSVPSRRKIISKTHCFQPKAAKTRKQNSRRY